jgi:hypothetical protein
LAYVSKYTGYVKFLRGTPDAWNSLAEKDKDTLYFISETDATTGKLYLGEKLISGAISGSSSLKDLSDVALATTIPGNSVIVYNDTTGKWENKLTSILYDIVSVMQGATSTTDGRSGLVPTPKAGQETLFLQGNGEWADPTSTLTATINGLIGSDTGKTIRDIAASEVAKIVANAPEDFDTLKEISDWIAEHEEVSDLSNILKKVDSLDLIVNGNDETQGLVAVTSDLKTELYGDGTDDKPGLVAVTSDLKTELYGDGTDDKIGLIATTSNLKVELYGDGTDENPGLIANFSILQATVGDLSTEMKDLDKRVDAIDERLKWQDLVEED